MCEVVDSGFINCPVLVELEQTERRAVANVKFELHDARTITHNHFTIATCTTQYHTTRYRNRTDRLS